MTHLLSFILSILGVVALCAVAYVGGFLTPLVGLALKYGVENVENALDQLKNGACNNKEDAHAEPEEISAE